MQQGPEAVSTTTRARSALGTRIVTGIALTIVATACMAARPPLAPLLFVQLFLALCIFELGDLLPDTRLWFNIVLGELAFALILLTPVSVAVWLSFGLTALATGLLLFGMNGKHRLANIIGGPLWLGSGMAATFLIQANTAVGGGSFGYNLAFVAIPAIWLGDTFAYLFGRLFGRHKMAPSISPKKTWEGAAGHLLGCEVAAIWFGNACGISPLVSLGCGLVASTVGQLGDLMQSALKRQVQKKDSGQLLPGHGGVLDRLDSMLLALPALLLCLWLALPAMFHVKQ